MVWLLLIPILAPIGFAIYLIKLACDVADLPDDRGNESPDLYEADYDPRPIPLLRTALVNEERN